MSWHGDRNCTPARLGLLLDPIGGKAKRGPVQKAPCDRAIERIDDRRDEGLREVESAPFGIGRESGLYLAPCRAQALIEIGPIAFIIEIEPEALKKEGDRARARVGAKIPVRPGAKFGIVISLAIRADQRCQFRL